jgi:hypothetical protein
MGKKRNAYRILMGKPEDLDIGTLEKSDGVVWTGFILLRIETSGGLL